MINTRYRAEQRTGIFLARYEPPRCGSFGFRVLAGFGLFFVLLGEYRTHDGHRFELTNRHIAHRRTILQMEPSVRDQRGGGMAFALSNASASLSGQPR
jgi:hypothetical protein